MMSAWELPEENRYTKDLLEGKGNCENEIKCMLSVLENYHSPEQTVGAETVEKHIRRAEDLKAQYDDLKTHFELIASEVDGKDERERGLKRKATSDGC